MAYSIVTSDLISAECITTLFETSFIVKKLSKKIDTMFLVGQLSLPFSFRLSTFGMSQRFIDAAGVYYS